MTPTTIQRIALFGATGGSGSATVCSFIKRQDFKDSIELRLMEGQLTDTTTIRRCLRDADTIICALGENRNIPGVRVLQDLAQSIVEVLNRLKSSSTEQWKKPRLILLSSSTWNDRFASQEPALVLWLLKTAFYHPYLDLRLATSHFKAAPELLSLLLVQPSALVDDEATGMEISTEKVSLAVSYADLGEGFVELATQGMYTQLDAVGVSSRGGNNFGKYGLGMLSKVVKGLIAGYTPGYWTWMNHVD